MWLFIRVLLIPLPTGTSVCFDGALQIFDKIIIAIAINPVKKPLFTLEERVDILKTVLKDYSRIEIDHFQGLLVDYVQRRETNIVLRGLRALSDFEYEFQYSLINRKLNQKVEMVFMMTDYKWFYISSTIIKEAASLGGNIDGLVPEIVNQRLREKFGLPPKLHTGNHTKTNNGTKTSGRNSRKKEIWE